MKTQSEIIEEAEEIIRRQRERRARPEEALAREVLQRLRDRLDGKQPESPLSQRVPNWFSQ
ncbi:MAG: hypothetical protein K9L88_07730 [Chromatiaceae bacterium]|nr:hypothetical protein [Chromatiaceae bacterium]